MKIIIEHHDGKYTSFNVGICGRDDEPFLTIKGCRVVDGSKGRFVSWPAKKMDSGKYWNHVYASDAFQEAVLKAHDESLPKKTHAELKRAKVSQQDIDDDIPF